MNKYLQGKTLHSQTREVVANVYKVCEKEAKNNAFKLPLKNKLDRAVLYTGVSRSTVAKIHREDKERLETNLEQPLSSPGKKRPRPSIKEKFNQGDFGVIRRTIEKFYFELKVVPTTRKLLQKYKEDMDFPYSRETLRRFLKANGFYWRKCRNKRKILMEKPNILSWRYKYMRAIKHFRQEGRNIVYIDETWVDNDITFQKCWQSDTVFGIISNISSTGRLITVHAGSENGFVENACLIFKAGLSTGDYHGQMNRQNFTKWLEEKLLPNIPENSVLVLDNAPYHSVQKYKTPTKSSTKKDIISWLSRKDIPHDPSLRKFDLFELVQLRKPPGDEKNYVIDNVIRSHGHTPLRTPPYMCEFNPIELAWAQLKYFIRSRNTTGQFTIKALKEITEEGIAFIGPSDWKKFCQHVMNIEDHYWQTDQHMEEVEPLIISLTGSDDESDTESSDSDVSDFESDKCTE